MPDMDFTTQRPEGTTAVGVQQTVERLARAGADRILQKVLETEVEEHLKRFAELRDEDGRPAVGRNGHAPQRTVYTDAGPVTTRRPRVDERAAKGLENHDQFSGGIPPRFLRRTPTLEEALGVLYLKGISTNDFPTA